MNYRIACWFDPRNDRNYVEYDGEDEDGNPIEVQLAPALREFLAKRTPSRCILGEFKTLDSEPELDILLVVTG